MSRPWVPAALLAAMLGFVRQDFCAVRAADPVPAAFIEEAGSNSAASDPSSEDPSAPQPDDAVSPGDLNPPSDDASEPDKLDAVAESEAEPETEIIRERYPNRAVKIEREVSQDENGNYINDGYWRMWIKRAR